MKRLLMCVAACAWPLVASAQTHTYTFEGTDQLTTDGYFMVPGPQLTVLSTVGAQAGSGYGPGTISGTHVLYGSPEENGASFASLTPFTLNSGFFTSALNEGVGLIVRGYRAGDLPPCSMFCLTAPATFRASFGLNLHSPTFIQFDWTDLVAVGFSTCCGTQSPDPYLQTDSYIFMVDDLTLTRQTTVTPEPASLVLLATGLLGIAAVRSRARAA